MAVDPAGMDIATAALLFAVALLGGGMNAVAGGGTFLTFPVLIFTGMPAIAANATSTVALWPGSMASNLAYREELARHTHRLPWLLVISLLGGIAGAVTLLLTPETTFTFLIPYLLLTATVLFTFGKPLSARLKQWSGHHEGADNTDTNAHKPTLAKRLLHGALQGTIAFYGGYFGAGIGILMLAVLQLMGMNNIHEMNGIKTLLASAINAASVATFVWAGVVLWPQALVMLAGAMLGGYGAARIARTLPEAPVRRVIMAIAWGMTLYFFWK